jgi:spore coat polysaccharide biosynthesis predicted glycosyltransferase SpsG
VELETRCREKSINYQYGAPVRSRSDIRKIEIFDGYQFESRHFADALEDGSMVVRIDDRPGTYRNCHVLVCHGPHAREEDFVTSDKCNRLLGPKYGLINPCFYENKARSAKSIKKLFISLGGGATDPILSAIISLVRTIQSDIDIDAMRGFWPGLEEIEQSAADSKAGKLTIYSGLSQTELGEKMAEADAAITAGGGTCLETAAMGLPTYLVAISENQIGPCEAMHERNLSFYSRGFFDSPGNPDVDKLRVSLVEFLTNASLRGSLSKRCRGFFRQSGATLVASEILSMANDQDWPTDDVN